MPSAHEKARLAKKKEAAKKKGGKKAVDEVTNSTYIISDCFIANCSGARG